MQFLLSGRRSRLLLGGVTIGLTALLVYVRLDAPPNFIMTRPDLPALGWQAKDATVTRGPSAGKFSGAPVLDVEAAGSDSYLAIRSLGMPAGSAVFSVYLRASQRTTIKLLLDGSATARVVARVTPQWQRFHLVAPALAGGPVMLLIGGEESFSKGEAVEVSGAQLQPGSRLTDYRPFHADEMSWIGSHVETVGLRQWAHWLLLGALAGWSWLIVSIPGARRCGTVAIDAISSFAAKSGLGQALRGAGVYLAIVLGCLVLLELVSFAACVVIAAENEPTQQAFRSVLKKGTEGFSRRPAQLANGLFSPLTQVRREVPESREPQDTDLPYLVNSLGLISNESPIDLAESMPDKPGGLVRLILYGGSTAMGIGARDGTETLTAQIERMLNARAKPGTTFQVLNFGHGGINSFTDLQFMASMGVYLQPDVSILLNGFNDAFYASESPLETRGRPYIVNWATYSHVFDSLMNGTAVSPAVSIRFLPYSSLLASMLIGGAARSQEAIDVYYQALPMRLVSEWVDKTHGRAFLLLQNLRFTAGYFIGRSDETLLSYLQPHPLQFRNLMTVGIPGATEQEQVTSWIAKGQRHDPEDYKKRMVEVFQSYGKVYETLEREYAQYPNIRFRDIRDVFEKFERPAFQDLIHYTPAGQVHLAARITRDLLEVEAIRRHIVD